MSIGATIRSIRVEKDIKLRVAAERAGMDPAALSRLESGQTCDPRLSTLARIAHAIEMPLDALIAIDAQTPTDPSELPDSLATCGAIVGCEEGTVVGDQRVIT